MIEKNELRAHLKQVRSSLSAARRKEASLGLYTHFKNSLSHSLPILSFCSFSDEIDLTLLNTFLMAQQALLFPRIEGDALAIYKVTSFSQLIKNDKGISEPDPLQCEKCNGSIAIALIPGLGFDSFNARLGYGKGYYDRLLPSLDCVTIGVGFTEQLVSKIPTESHDLTLDKILLF